MKHDDDVRHLNIEIFTRAQGELNGRVPLASLGRLVAEAAGPVDGVEVHYAVHGSTRVDSASHAQLWIHLTAEVAMPQICQRCLGPVELPVPVEREFRFVATEEQAELEDEDSEEDVLVLNRDFNLLELIEDELIMALPVVPKHVVCPSGVKMRVADPDFSEEEAVKPNPFAVLGVLKNKP